MGVLKDGQMDYRRLIVPDTCPDWDCG